MSNDSDDRSPAQKMFQPVPGTPFVDFRPDLGSDELVKFMLGPFADLAAKIDVKLSQIEGKVAALAHRVATLEDKQKMEEELRAKRKKRKHADY